MNEVFVGTVVGVTVGILAWLGSNLWESIKNYIAHRNTLKVTPAKEWRKAAETRRKSPGYKTSEQFMEEAIREYRETGKCSPMPTEKLEMLLLMTSAPPIIAPSVNRGGER